MCCWMKYALISTREIGCYPLAKKNVKRKACCVGLVARCTYD